MFNILMIVITLLMITVLVVVHEFGHYLTAKRFGIYIAEFSIGMGPCLYQKKNKETAFSIRAFPIGGFCRMAGEEDGDEEIEEELDIPSDLPPERRFNHLEKWKKIVVLAAGPLLNVLLAIVTMCIIYLFRGASFGEAAVSSFAIVGKFSVLIAQSLQQLIVGNASINDFAGPIGMVGMVGEYYKQGAVLFFIFAALISVNLGVLNLLPFPALDGGQIVISLIEWISRRDVSPKIINAINAAGFAILLGFSFIVAVNDVFRYV